MARPPRCVFVGQPTAKNFLWQVAARFLAEGAGFDDPVVWHRLDSRFDVFRQRLQVTTKSENDELGPWNMRIV